MTTNSLSVNRTVAITATTQPSSTGVITDPSVSALSSQVVQLTAMVSEMHSRLVASDFRPSDVSFGGRPPPEPPFSTDFSPQKTGSIPMFTFTPTPSVGLKTQALSLPPFSLGSSQTLAQQMTIPMPQFGFQDTGGSIPTTTRIAQPVPQPWQSCQPEQRSTDRLPISHPQMVSASSCWGPPGPITTFGTFQPDQHRPKVKMDPPRFDGTKVNNWIRGVQFYFDHVGTPKAQRLHYVIMLFEPGVADWIWNYCSSHESVTWHEFLDDVWRRFDPQFYISHVGLLKKLQQTGTVSDYQLAFEKLQSKVVGVPDHVLLDLYVAGLKQTIQDDILLHRLASLAAAFAMALQIASYRTEAPQPQSSFSRRQWQPRDSQGSPQVTASQASPAPVNCASFLVPRSQERRAFRLFDYQQQKKRKKGDWGSVFIVRRSG